MSNGVVLGKLRNLDVVLGELQSLGTVTSVQLNSDWRTRRAIERDLQVLAEVVIDVCHRLLAETGETPAQTATEAIQRCVALGALSSSKPYESIVRFRNFVVHQYERVDVDVLTDIVNHHLQVFVSFRDEIVGFVEKSDEQTDEEQDAPADADTQE
jgi:uncharacterized protein YutE (UPF0331/DUF86 family)